MPAASTWPAYRPWPSHRSPLLLEPSGQPTRACRSGSRTRRTPRSYSTSFDLVSLRSVLSNDSMPTGSSPSISAAKNFLVVLPPGSTAADPFRLRDLAFYPLVAAPPGSSTRRLLDDALKKSAANAVVVVEAAQREALLPLIVAGAGAGLLPRPLAETAATLGCVVVEPRPKVSREVALVYRQGTLTPAARRFIQLAAEHK